MAINRGPFNALIDDDGSGTTGSVWNKAAIQGVILDPVDALVPDWAVTPYNAGDYAADPPMGFQVNPGTTYSLYQKTGRLLHWVFYTENATTTGSPSGNLYIHTPTAVAAAMKLRTHGRIYTSSTGWIDVDIATAAPNAYVILSKYDGSVWPVAGGMYLNFQIVFPY